MFAVTRSSRSNVAWTGSGSPVAVSASKRFLALREIRCWQRRIVRAGFAVLRRMGADRRSIESPCDLEDTVQAGVLDPASQGATT